MVDNDPSEEIKRIKSDYENRLKPAFNKSKQVRLGSLWLNPTTNSLYICNGQVNGEPKWTLLADDVAQKILNDGYPEW